MRIEGETPGETLREAWVLLTRQEALDLRQAIDSLLTDADDDGEWHEHVTSEDGAVELTIGPHRDSTSVP